MTPPKPTWEQVLAPVAPTATGSFGASFGGTKPAAAKPAQRASFVPASAPPVRPPGASEPVRVYALAPPSPLARDVRNPMLATVEQSPYVKALFARVADSEIKPEIFWKLAAALNEPMARAAMAIDDSPEDGVGVLELVLADKLVHGMTESELHMPDDGIRQVKNRVIAWSRPSLTAQVPPAPVTHGRDGEAPAPEASMASFAGLAAAAASGMGRQHDGKTGEETSASESRLQAAYEDASVKSAIFDLSNNSEKKELQALKTEVQRALAALKKAQAAPKPPYKPPGAPASAPEDLRKTLDEKKAAKKAKKARQAARKAAREAGETVGADTADEAEDE